MIAVKHPVRDQSPVPNKQTEMKHSYKVIIPSKIRETSNYTLLNTVFVK
jgi:hypothetical protein